MASYQYQDTYSKVVTNTYLGLSKEIKGRTPEEVEAKAQLQLKQWYERELRERERERVAQLKAKAESDTEAARNLILSYRLLLHNSLSSTKQLNWNSLHKHTPFPPFKFSEPRPILTDFTRAIGVPSKSFLERFSAKLKQRREALEAKAQEQFEEAMTAWEQRKAEASAQYEEAKKKHERAEEEHNKAIDDFRDKYEKGDSAAVVRYITTVLDNSQYPSGFKKEYKANFDTSERVLVLDYYIPTPDRLPQISEYRYVAKDKAVQPVHLKPKEVEELFESVAYQLVLRSIHEVFESDYAGHIQSVVFNGWVRGIDKATGKQFTSCILSCRVSRDEFKGINLHHVDPKLCFRNLKGLSAGPLHNLAPVKPVLTLSRDDPRFVESRDVLAEANAIPNLATMDWEDFEHLVRGLFEKMFSQPGTEVKITQASRDMGVDAVAFDPDPIRGGKFVIQAKRYNNVVPLSAVRDLYGTVINEGAARGILVTTSHFGSDSYEFVKDKPITLIDGQNLVYLLAQQGYTVRIEVRDKHD